MESTLLPGQLATTTSVPSIPIPQTGGELLSALKSENGIALFACVLALIALSIFGKGKKSNLARGRFGGSKEKGAARKISLKQMKERKRNAVALYLGKPRTSFLGKSDRGTIYLPDAQRGIAVCGGPGTGKTFSLIDPAIRSAIDQGFPLILYDFKYPDQTEKIVGYAESSGYDIRFFLL